MKKVVTIFLAIVFIMAMITSVNAVSGTVTSTATSNNVSKEETFGITLSAKADSPIDGFYTKINYDKSILSLEKIETSYSNDSGEGEIYLKNNSIEQSPTETTLATLIFKVLDTSDVKSTDISFSDSELHLKDSESLTDIEFSTNINKVTVNFKGVEDNNNNDIGEENTPSNKNTGNNNTTNNSNNSTKNDTTKKTTTKIAQTGLETGIIFAIAGVSIISIISYLAYKKYNNI